MRYRTHVVVIFLLHTVDVIKWHSSKEELKKQRQIQLQQIAGVMK